MMPLQAAALAQLERSGAPAGRIESLRGLAFPAARMEDWRYFPLRTLALKRFVDGGTQDAAPVGDPRALALHWIDGRLDRSAAGPMLAAGIALGRAVIGPAEALFAGLAQLSAPERSLVRIGRSLAAPLWLRQHAGSQGVAGSDLVVQVGNGVQATVIEDLRGVAREHAALSLLKVRVGSGAQLTWLRLLDDDARSLRYARSRFHLMSGAQLRWYGLDQQVGVARHELRLLFKGKGASASIRGGALVDGREFDEHRLELVHAAPGCDSDTLWKLVGRRQGRAVFNGRIQIDAGADRTDAQLKTANLLLSEQAEIDCKPELEIHADEVRASHGATVGQLDERALFYLRSRGIGVQEARALLIGAFVRELFDELADPTVRQVVEHALERRLPALDLVA